MSVTIINELKYKLLRYFYLSIFAVLVITQKAMKPSFIY